MHTRRVRGDWWIFYAAIFLIMFGLLMVYSASSVKQAHAGAVADLDPRDGAPSGHGESDPARTAPRSSFHFVIRQTGWAIVAVAAFLAARRWDYRKLCQAKVAFPALSVAIVLVLAAYVIGDSHHRWIRLGPLGFQPSELAKPALVIFLAYLLTRREDVNRWGTLAPLSLAVGMLTAAVLIADLGTGFVLTVCATVLLWTAGLRKRFLAAALSLAVLGIVLMIWFVPYRLVRVVAFLGTDHPIVQALDHDGSVREEMRKTRYGSDPNYQLNQSLVAIGSGGPRGRGLGQGVQKISYIPEAHTDFILAVIGEELGLWGTLLVLSAYLVLLWRGLRLASLAGDSFGCYLALGITTLYIVQAFFNMSVVLGLAPTKGITLPLISYGGSSLFGTMLSLGLLSSVSEHSPA